MAVPSKKYLHLPALEIAAKNGGIVSVREFHDTLAVQFEMTKADLDDRSSSGSRRFYNRVSFALQELNVGVVTQRTYEIKQLDENYFSEDI